MTDTILGICSMAPRPILEPLFESAVINEQTVHFQAVGGVDAAKRVAQGDAFDLVVLSRKAIDALIDNGHAQPGSRVDIAVSSVAIAVGKTATPPDIGNKDQLQQTMMQAEAIGYSTGPSGVAILAMIEQWGLSDALKDKMHQSPPGVPVGQLLADGKVSLGFQQKSELMHIDGIQLLGTMPAGCEIDTTFSGAVCTVSKQPAQASAVLAYLQSDAVARLIRANGMTPVAQA